MANLISSLWNRLLPKPLPRPTKRDGIYAIVTVQDPSGRRSQYEFSKPTVSRGLSIGSDSGCDIRLTGAGVRPVHARLQPASNHWVLSYLPEGQRLPLPEEFGGPYDDRVDRVPFKIEGHRLQVDDS